MELNGESIELRTMHWREYKGDYTQHARLRLAVIRIVDVTNNRTADHGSPLWWGFVSQAGKDDTPLDFNRVKKGGLKFVVPVSRWAPAVAAECR